VQKRKDGQGKVCLVPGTCLGSRPVATGLYFSASHSGRNRDGRQQWQQREPFNVNSFTHSRHIHIEFAMRLKRGLLRLIDAQEFPICLSGKMKSVFCFSRRSSFSCQRGFTFQDYHTGEETTWIPQTTLMSGA